MSELEKKLEAALRKNLAELKKTKIKLESLERMQHEPIAVIGMSCRLPHGANTPEAYWELLSKGIDAVSEVPNNRWDIQTFYDANPEAPGKMITTKAGFIENVDLFDSEHFRISAREAQSMDPQQRLLLELAWEALERAGIAPDTLEGSLSGVFIGASYSDHSALIQRTHLDQLGTYSALSISLSALNGRISYTLGLMGPSMTIDTACSSSLTSVHLACNSLQKGECNLAIAGGVYLMLSPAVFIMLSRAKMLAPDGHCKTFDASADGYGRGEGAGIIILKRLSDAIRDRDTILAIIRGSSVNQDGASSGLTVPNRVAQVQLIEGALKAAKLKPTDISYVEAHGTGTELGDPIEVGAIKDVYGKERPQDHPLLLGSVKSNIGHLEGAAGIAGIIKIILSLKHEAIPPNLHFQRINPKINLDAIPAKIITELTPWKSDENQPRRAGISGFGFTGTNAHMIVEEAPKIEMPLPSIEERPLHILTLSAKTESALKALVTLYENFLRDTKESLADICYTANIGRNHERYRLAVIVKDIAELKAKLPNTSYVKVDRQVSGSSVIPFSGDWNDYLNQLVLSYTSGNEIDWKKFDEPYTRKKILLPTYPFQRIAYPILGALLTDEKQSSIPDIFYEWTWENVNLPDTQYPEPLGSWLVIGEPEISHKLMDQLTIKGGSCRFVTLTDLPKTKEEFVGLLREVPTQGILYLTVDSEPREFTVASIQDTQVRCTQGLLNLTQALVQVQTKNRLPLCIVSSTGPEHAPLQGLFKTIVGEIPELEMKFILLNKSPPDLILKAIFNTSNEIFLKLDRELSYVPRVKKIIPEVKGELKLRQDSSYLITGAMGGLGQTLARTLADKGAGRLILTGRKIPDLKQLKDLETDGTEIIFETLDVSDEKSVSDLLGRLNTAEKPLKGIFHLAGILDDGTLLELNWSRFEKVFASKLYGSFYLHQYSKNLDYFVLFSSLASTLGSPGQANYAAACAFMDALAEYRRSQGLVGHSFSWGPWSEIGMAKELVHRHARAGFLGINPQVGMQSLQTAMLLQPAHITIANMDWNKYIDHMIRALPWLKNFGEQHHTIQDLRSELMPVNAMERLAIVKKKIGDIVRDVFGTPASQPIDEKMGFFDMGMDSLMAVEIRNRLQVLLGKDVLLDSVAVFNYPNIESIGQHLLQLMNLETEIEAPDVEEAKKEEIEKAVDEMDMEEVLRKLRGEQDGK